MAENKIQYSDLIEADALPKLISELKKVENIMDDIAASAKKVVTESAKMAETRPLTGYNNLNEIQKDIDKVAKAVENLKQAEAKRGQALADREKLEVKLAKLRTQEAKDLALFKLKISEEAKALRDQAKATNDAQKATEKLFQAEAKRAKMLENKKAKEAEKAANSEAKRINDEAKAAANAANAFKVLTKATNEAQDEFKRLAAAHGLNSKEAKEAFEKFDKLDKRLRAINETARDGRRDVGRYKIAVEGVNKSLSALEKIGIITLLLKIGEMFGQNADGAAALEKVFGRITISVGVFVSRLVTLLPLAEKAFSKLSLAVQIFLLDARILFDKITPYISWIGDIIQVYIKVYKTIGSAIGGALAEIAKSVPALEASNAKQQELEDRAKALGAAYDALGDVSISDVTKAFEGMGDEISALIKRNDALIESTKTYKRLIMGIDKKEADLDVRRQKAAQRAGDDTLSMKEMREAAQELLNIEKESAVLQLKGATETLKRANEAKAIRVGNMDAEREATDAYVALQAAKGRADVAQMNAFTEGRKIERDQMEQDLDILLDISDRRKTVNETIMADETLSIEARAQALADSEKDIEESFRKQADVIQKFTGHAFNIDDLINEKDTVKFNEMVKAIIAAEIPINRLREVIIERLQATEDQRLSTIALTKAKEKQRATEADILLQEEAFLQLLGRDGKEAQKVIDKLAEKRDKLAMKELEARIALLQTKRKVTDTASQEELTARQQLNDKLLAQQQKQAEKELEIEQKKQEERKAQVESTAEFLTNISKKISDERVSDIDKTIEASAKRESDLVELAAKGSEDATKALAFERKAQAELALQRDKEIQKQARRELALSAAKIFGAKVAGGVPAGQALAQTGAELLALQSIVNALPSFYDGAERVGDELDATMPGRDGHLIRVDGDERILSPSQSAMIPRGMSNMELALLSRERATGRNGNDASDVLAKKLDSIERAIRQQPVLTDRVFDADRQAVVSTTKRGTALLRKHKSLGLNG